MKPSQKPEWLELADNDNSRSIRKVSRGLPVLALVATVAIIGVGAVFAQPQGLSVANAEGSVATTTQVAPPATPIIDLPSIGTVSTEDDDSEDLYNDDDSENLYNVDGYDDDEGDDD